MKTILAVSTWALAFLIMSGCSKGSMKSVVYHFFESLKNGDKESLENLFIAESEFIEKTKSAERDNTKYQNISDIEIRLHYQEIKSKFFDEIEQILYQVRQHGGWSNANLDVVSINRENRKIESFGALINFKQPEEAFTIRLDGIVDSNQKRWAFAPYVRIVVASTKPEKARRGGNLQIKGVCP
ncbi:hypothetical protein [Microbulbifer sp.]|uniref:hypothetical protein n=1 Tax=Microbulbifer sp. TaxID=1908541 RepID=UPI003F36EBB9